MGHCMALFASARKSKLASTLSKEEVPGCPGKKTLAVAGIKKGPYRWARISFELAGNDACGPPIHLIRCFLKQDWYPRLQKRHVYWVSSYTYCIKAALRVTIHENAGSTLHAQSDS